MDVPCERIERLYTDAFCARDDTIPLIVSPPCPPPPAVRELRDDPAKAVARAAEALRPKLAVGSDWLPTVNVGLFQCIAVPSLYGAKLVDLPGSEPLCEPVFPSVEAAAAAPVPDVAGPVVDELLAFIDAAQQALPPGFRLSVPASASPFDLAQLLVGQDYLLGLIASPDATAALLHRLAGLFIELTRLVKRRMGRPDRQYVTNRGMYLPGFRLPADAIVNLSPDLLRRFVLPVLEPIAAAFGPLCVHFCTDPAPSAHVLPVLLESRAVLAVDNWQGPDVFLGPDAPARMQAKIAVVGDYDLTTPEKMDEVLARPPVRNVPRRGGRGLVMATTAQSVEHGRRIVAEWRGRFGR